MSPVYTPPRASVKRFFHGFGWKLSETLLRTVAGRVVA